MRCFLNSFYLVVFFIVCVCGDAEARKLECKIHVTNALVDLGLKSEYPSYVVNVSGFIQCSHHTGKNGAQGSYRETLFPVVAKSDAEALTHGYKYIQIEAHKRLRMECKNPEFSCDCEAQGCTCNGCSPILVKDDSLGREGQRNSKLIKKGDDENSILNPINLNHRTIRNIDGIMAAQQAYIDKYYEGYYLQGDILAMHEGRYIQIIPIINEGGHEKFIYFDMTDIYKKLERSRNKATKNRIKDIMKDHMPLEKEEKTGNTEQRQA